MSRGDFAQDERLPTSSETLHELYALRNDLNTHLQRVQQQIDRLENGPVKCTCGWVAECAVHKKDTWYRDF